MGQLLGTAYEMAINRQLSHGYFFNAGCQLHTAQVGQGGVLALYVITNRMSSICWFWKTPAVAGVFGNDSVQLPATPWPTIGTQVLALPLRVLKT